MDKPVPAPTLLASLPPEEQRFVLRFTRPVEHARAALLFGVRENCDCLLMVDGLASLHVRVGSHLSGSVGLVGRSGLLGVPSLLGADAPHHVAVAVTRVKGLAITPHDLRSCVNELPNLRRAVSRYVSRRFAEALVCSACNLEHGLGPRLADWICRASALLGSDSVPVTHERLSEILGVARPSVTLALQSLEEQQAIMSRRGRIVVRDATILAALACGCGSGPSHPAVREVSHTIQSRNSS